MGFYFLTMLNENRFEMLGVTNAVNTFYKRVYKCVYNNNDNNNFLIIFTRLTARRLLRVPPPGERGGKQRGVSLHFRHRRHAGPRAASHRPGWLQTQVGFKFFINTKHVNIQNKIYN